MKTIHSNEYKTENEKIIPKLDEYLTVNYLKEVLHNCAIPRHFVKESENNKKVGEYITNEFIKAGHSVDYQGEYRNIIATMGNVNSSDPTILVGAHYDSVPGCAGADDNGSALAVLLATAKVLPILVPDKNFVFVAFNREEDGLLGSRDFVSYYQKEKPFLIETAHILEMVGYTSKESNSQSLPEGLPINIPDVGDFLALVSSHQSNNYTQMLVEHGGSYVHELPILALQIPEGLEFIFADVLRSDHAPFWMEGISATMWTDTSEFRNKNYHKPSDTIDTLDFEFMRNVAKLLIGALTR